jgi:hypothetical protein
MAEFVFEPPLLLRRGVTVRTLNDAGGEWKAFLHDQVVGIATAAGIGVIDLQFAFRDQSDPWSFFPSSGGHYNSKGHQFIGAKIVEAIRTQRLLSPATTANAK